MSLHLGLHHRSISSQMLQYKTGPAILLITYVAQNQSSVLQSHAKIFPHLRRHTDTRHRDYVQGQPSGARNEHVTGGEEFPTHRETGMLFIV